MICPHCGTEVAESRVCPSCGYGLVRTPVDPRSALDEPTLAVLPEPLADFDLVHTNVNSELGVGSSVEPVVSDGAMRSGLPLFPAGWPVSAAPSTRRGSYSPLNSNARPLGVRRQTPRVPRRQSRRAPKVTQPMALKFEEPIDVKSNRRESAVAGSISASLVRRFGAAAIDLFIVGVIDVGVLSLTARLAGLPIESVTELPLLPLIGFLTLINSGYVVTLTGFGGQTIGKMVFGIRVVSNDGAPASLWSVFVRSAAHFVSVLPFGLGFINVLFGAGRAFHDVVAETNVVRRQSL